MSASHPHAPCVQLLSVLLVCLAACSREAPPDAGADLLARERAAAAFEKEKFGEARAALAPLAARPKAAADDLLSAAAVEYADSKPEECARLLERAASLDAGSARLAYLRGQLARDAGDFARARPFFEAALRAAPGDLPTRLALAEALYELGEAQAAEEHYKAVIAVGIENGTSWYVAAVYRLMRVYVEAGRDAEALKYQEVWSGLERLGIRQPGAGFMARGNLGLVRPPRASGTRVAAKPELPKYTSAVTAILPELADARELHAEDLDGDARIDLWALTPAGLFAALRSEQSYRVVQVAAGPIDRALAFDLDNDPQGDLDFVLVRGSELTFLRQDEGSFTPVAIPLPVLPSAPRDLLAVDYDHESDMDLLFAGDFGARIWRNDGAGMPEQDGKKGLYTDATPESGLPTGARFDWCATEDFDGDNDVDFLFGGAQGPYLADSLRAGRFADRTSAFPAAGPRLETEPVLADFDGDARVDLWTATLLYRQRADAGFTAEPRKDEVPVEGSRVLAQDLDLDGALDLVWIGTGNAAEVRLAVGLAEETRSNVRVTNVHVPSGMLALGDLDGNGSVDLAVSSPAGVFVLAATPGANKAKAISLRGLRDNKRAVGSVLEYRAGSVYRRVYWRGSPLLAGVGQAPRIDVLRVTWPNGTVNTEIDVDLVATTSVDDPDAAYGSILQPPAQVGSCPFLYSWNGTEHVFVTDVLGITPLGLPIAPGVLVQPDHDEYVLVRGEELAPKDGAYELHFTEELREVTYLDHARLLVVDHAEGTEVFPNERFTFPPFPEPHTHTVRGALAPASARGSDGKDWTTALAAIDDRHAVPFTLQPLQFAGLCQPWFVELSFDKAQLADAKQLRLLMTGWFFWSDASANMASARAPGVAFVPPLLQVPDGNGGWKDAGPPVGFPAGKTKTMVIDVSAILDREDPRLRVFTTLRLYWDAVRLAVDADDAPLTVHTLAASSARLWMRGFSAPLGGGDVRDALASQVPERFDWEVLSQEPRWNQHPGLYTKLGDVLELLGAVDDRFVILGAGDALTLRFDARALPAPAPGMRRDFLVYLDGWAKDRDPNTIQALEVEPLPFHGMSGYPYRADERFPDDEAHRRWRAEWNTRPAFEWIQPLAPIRQRAWLAGE